MHPHMPFNARVEGQVSKCLGDTRLHLAQDRLLRVIPYLFSLVASWNRKGRWAGQVGRAGAAVCFEHRKVEAEKG